MKIYLGIFVMVLSISAYAVPQFSDVARNADGSIFWMSWMDAVRYCAKQGMHLPSAREWAELATSLGAAGISEISDPVKSEPPYHPIYRPDSERQLTTDFYFDYHGFKPSTNDLRTFFWSSTHIPTNFADYIYTFYGELGYLDLTPQNAYPHLYAVECAVGP